MNDEIKKKSQDVIKLGCGYLVVVVVIILLLASLLP